MWFTGCLLYYKTVSNYSYTASKNAIQKIYYNVPYGATKPYGQSSDYTYETVTAQVQDPKMLDYITCATGKINFKTSVRDDLTDAQRLDSVTFYNRDPITKAFTFEKKVILYYDDGLKATRLVLDSAREFRSGAYYPATKFVYNGGPPESDTYKIDYGGYFNNVANTNPLPAFVFGNTVYNEGNSRNPDSTVVANGVLKKVTSPAGGVTTYKFESNTYVALDTAGHGYNAVAPGLRIKRITQTDPFSNIQAVTNYEYSGGTLAYQPSYFTTLPVKDVVGGVTYNYNCYIARSNPVGDGASGGPPIMYKYVT